MGEKRNVGGKARREEATRKTKTIFSYTKYTSLIYRIVTALVQPTIYNDN
jgi:hypothetical protein